MEGIPCEKIKKWVDNLYSILPFEVGFYKRHGYNVTYVGESVGAGGGVFHGSSSSSQAFRGASGI